MHLALSIKMYQIKQKVFQVQQYLAPRAIMPPPLRWFYYFARIVKRVKEMR